jgi:Arc/MetJ-type ribon-helix-helix transcriptional regulator
MNVDMNSSDSWRMATSDRSDNMATRSVTLDNELESALDEYIADQPDGQTVASVVRSALREYLGQRGYASQTQRLVDSPASPDTPYVATDADRRRADEIHSAIDAFFELESTDSSGATVAQVALREYLKIRGVMMPTEPFCPKTAEHGSGYRNTSREHDSVLAETID